VSLPFDDAAADQYARIRHALEQAGQRIGAHDLEIASIALAHDLTVVSHNVRVFSRVPDLRLEDWEA
jgi:tRNA(fMet)-specific endonuclease VapC